MEFNEKLQELRKRRGLTQEDLAQALFVSRTAISKWESGRGYPSIDSLKSISRFFSVSIDELICQEEIISAAEEDKQSFACLASRFVYGETISKEKLGMVDKAEQLLLDLGFHQVRVRIHGTMARIEIHPDEFAKLISDDVRLKITEAFMSFGFSYVSMDLTGYRTEA